MVTKRKEKKRIIQLDCNINMRNIATHFTWLDWDINAGKSTEDFLERPNRLDWGLNIVTMTLLGNTSRNEAGPLWPTTLSMKSPQSRVLH